MGHPAVVVPLTLWNPTTNSDWDYRGNLDDRTGQPHTLDDLFAFVERSWYSRPEFSDKARWTVGHVRKLCREARLPEQPNVGNIIGFVEYLRSRYEPGTVYQWWSALRTVFELGSKAGYSRGNPAWPLHLTKPKGKPHRIRNINELWPALMDACHDARERGFVAVQRYAGVRRSEALGLKAGDVLAGVEGAELLIRRQRPSPNAWASKPTKGKRARNVPLHPELERMLREVIAEGPVTIRVGRGGQRAVQCEFLFPFREDELRDLGERLRAVAPEAFPRGRKMWHALRDTFAIEMYEAGADIGMIRDWLGHSTETVTHTNYIGDVAVRVRRDTLRFVGASPPKAEAPPGMVLGGAESGAEVARTTPAPERSKGEHQAVNQEVSRCSTPSRSGKSSKRRSGSSSRTRSGNGQRSLPRLAVGPVVRRPR